MNNEYFNPLVSIVIPVYNGANYMREAIDSALSQTYSNIEVIIVNDGSRDDGATEKIAISYGDKIVYYAKANGGCGSALNFGIERMRGDYFSWLSHDDTYYPEKIEHQIQVLSSLPDKDTIIYGGYDVINNFSKKMFTVRPHLSHPIEKLEVPLYPLLRGLMHGCSMLIPAKYFRDIGLFKETLPSTQDYDLWFKFLRVAPVHYDSRIVIRSRVHPDQGTNKISGHILECNELWCKFISSLTEAEMIQMEGSKYLFMLRTAHFLDSTQYHDAQILAEQLAENALESILISVVIPFHNRINWLLEAIESVQTQTHQFFEILLIDDGSTEYLDSLLKLVQSDSRIKYTWQENTGPAKARNKGISLAMGKYIAFLDSDDLFCPEKLYKQLKYMESRDLQISHTSYQRIDLLGHPIEIRNSGALSGIIFPRIIFSCPVATPTVMVKTDIFKLYQFPENIDIGEDVCLWLKLSSENVFGGIDEVLSKVRIGPQTAAINSHKQISGLLNIASFIIQDPVLNQYGNQLRILMIDIVRLIPNNQGPELNFAKSEFVMPRKGFFLRVMRFIKLHGVFATAKRAGYILLLHLLTLQRKK